MVIKILTPDYEMKSFDCGDADLNDFLLNDAKLFAEKKIANTYILEDKGCIVAYYSLLNDKVSKMDATNSAWKRVKKLFPHSKQFSSYPSVKIGRFPFYEKNGFKMFLSSDEDKHTRAMYFDLLEME